MSRYNLPAFQIMRSLNAEENTLREEECRTDVEENNHHEPCDVVVCGGGPAGIAAAISAAREGASVQLIERHNCLGGVWTAGLLSVIIDFGNKTGVMAELMARLDARGGAAYKEKGGFSGRYDAEAMKVELDAWCLAEGVDVRLHTMITGVRVADRDGRLKGVFTESKSGREFWPGKVFIDATGDGDLAARAGCAFDWGHPETGLTQPMSLIAILTGLDEADMKPYICGDGSTLWGEPMERLKAIMESHGVSPSYAHPTLSRLPGGLFALMANHQYLASGIDAGELTRATMEARREVWNIIESLKAEGGIWSGIRLAATGAQIGVREGRRIHGLYRLTKEDLIRGARFPDAVCRVTFGVDIHALDPSKGKGLGSGGVKSQPYDIPLRSLVARDVEGLLLAGRCISGDFWAHGSYRVTGNAVTMGESVGRFGAQCALENLLPRETALSKAMTGEEVSACNHHGLTKSEAML